MFPNSGEHLGEFADTVVLIGSPYKHELSERVIDVLAAELNVELSFPVFDEKMANSFGYPSRFVHMCYQKERYTPRREPQNAIEGRLTYEDYGVILYGSVKEIIMPDSSPFPPDAKRILLISGTHRLASGAGLNAVLSAKLRKIVFGDRLDFRAGHSQILAFKVTVSEAVGFDTPAMKIEVL